jgi:hypothetical protein
VKLSRRNLLYLAAGAAALPPASRLTWAQTYPTRPITIVVPYPAGGPTADPSTSPEWFIDGRRVGALKGATSKHKRQREALHMRQLPSLEIMEMSTA